MSAVAAIQGGKLLGIIEHGQPHTFEGSVSYLTIEAAKAAGYIKEAVEATVVEAVEVAPEIVDA